MRSIHRARARVAVVDSFSVRILRFSGRSAACLCLVRPSSSSAPSSAPSPSSHIAGDLDLSHPLSERHLHEIKRFSDLPEGFGVNQHIPIDNHLKEHLRGTLWKFKAPIRYAFAYGSGVFSQGTSAQTAQKPQIDLIFGVSHVQHWHSLNITQYPEHYSALRRLGSAAVARVQELGAGVYFNPYVELNGLVIKYGVISIERLTQDLLSWDTLYVSGRLHKPVKILRDDPRVRLANQRNLFSVLRTALLLLPETFTEHELYSTIASISYTGDPRMQVGAENPQKVTNIVTNQIQHFHRLYAPLIDTLPNLQLSGAYDNISLSSDFISLKQDMDPVRRGNMVARLPTSFKQRLYDRYAKILSVDPSKYSTPVESAATEANPGYNHPSSKILPRLVGTEFDRMIAARADLPQEVSRAIIDTVKWPAAVQSAKGIATAGLSKGFKYLGEKFAKRRAAAAAAAERSEEKPSDKSS
ncbi:MMP37-like protein [Myxozyma melibiosi]|uniref:Phosphatidate cytidylyltransferase, mitochondrial n=1 Tax=Myxozyma melibiosi TaxID=54550 RepID=A0ABR1F9W0_9ASCO